MKYFLLLGGFCGFVLAFIASWHAGNAPGFALRDAAIGCLVGAFLWRGLHAVLMKSLRSHLAAQAALNEASPQVGTPQAAR